MELLWLQSLAVLFIVALLGPGAGEQFFQYRDHRDQNKYSKQNSEENLVKNEHQAEVQLEKYGYLTCKIARKRRSAFPNMGSISEGNEKQIPEERNECSEVQLSEAIKNYQKTYKLPQTGYLDERTRQFMSTSRCGNTDNEEQIVVEEAAKDVVLGADHVIGKPSTNLNNALKSNNRKWKRSLRSTKIMKVLAGQDRTPSIERRGRYLTEYINRLKREDPLMLKPISEEDRRKRSIIVHTNHTNGSLANPSEGQMFNKDVIRWRLLDTGYSTRIPTEQQRATIDLAFRMWSEVIPRDFVEDNNGDLRDVDIQVAFGKGAHQNCDRNFDGSGGELAHSWHAGNMHFDDEENFKAAQSFTEDGIYLLRVAVHEIGHVLGLAHTSKSYSIMYAIYEGTDFQPDFELGWEDRKAVQEIYGVCKGKFSTVFDWVRKRPDNTFIYNTYFFRENLYWMYENHANRTRYGDPLFIAREWGNVPDNPDAYAHVWYFTGNTVVDDAFFFKDGFYYKYDSDGDTVFDDWPRRISDDFGPKPGQTEGVPDNLDSVIFDKRDQNIYFFKGEWVYVFDPKQPEETRGCCERKLKIVEEFPVLDGEEAIPSSIDAAYISYKDQSMYLFRDEDVWQNTLYHPRQKVVKNGMKYIGKWFKKWFDICDVKSAKKMTPTT